MRFEGDDVVNIHGPREAASLGIEVVYQDLALADNLDVVANMFLGRERNAPASSSTSRSMEQAARETLDSLSVTTLQSVRQMVAGLSGGQRQAVAVAKSVMWNSKLVILDEPTAALGVAQTRQVLDLVRRLADRGLGVVIISHNLHDVFEVRRPDHGAAARTAGGRSSSGRDRPAGGRPRHHGRRARSTSRAWPTRSRHERPTPRAAVEPGPDVVEPLTAAGRRARRLTAADRVRGAADLRAGRGGSGCRAGELGSLPIIVGLAVIVIVFGLARRHVPHRAELHQPAPADGGASPRSPSGSSSCS